MKKILTAAITLSAVALSVNAAPDWNREMVNGSYTGLTQAQPVSSDFADQAQAVTAVLASGAIYGSGVSDPITDLNNGTGAKTGNGVLGDDFPGNGNTDIWVTFDLGSPQAVGAVHVFSENADARVFQHYILDSSPDGSTWTPVIEVIGSTEKSFPTADTNDTNPAACVTAVWDDSGTLFNAQHVRLRFYASGNTTGSFVDQYDNGTPGDLDGAGAGVNAAAQSSVLTEIDVLAATSFPVELSVFSAE